MTPATIIGAARAEGVGLVLSATGTIKATGERAAVNRWVPLIREHKPGILAALREAANALKAFCFSAPGDPANDDDALRQRVAATVEEWPRGSFTNPRSNAYCWPLSVDRNDVQVVSIEVRRFNRGTAFREVVRC
jgi:hypothetical protein